MRKEKGRLVYIGSIIQNVGFLFRKKVKLGKQ